MFFFQQFFTPNSLSKAVKLLFNILNRFLIFGSLLLALYYFKNATILWNYCATTGLAFYEVEISIIKLSTIIEGFCASIEFL